MSEVSSIAYKGAVCRWFKFSTYTQYYRSPHQKEQVAKNIQDKKLNNNNE